jgi:hypothetical protein
VGGLARFLLITDHHARCPRFRRDVLAVRRSSTRPRLRPRNRVRSTVTAAAGSLPWRNPRPTCPPSPSARATRAAVRRHGDHTSAACPCRPAYRQHTVKQRCGIILCLTVGLQDGSATTVLSGSDMPAWPRFMCHSSAGAMLAAGIPCFVAAKFRPGRTEHPPAARRAVDR